MVPPRVLACLLACVAALPFGCAGSPKPTSSALPDDFALSISVLPASGAAPCWFMVGPDGVLRGALGERQQNSVRPAGVRQLSRGEVRGLYEQAWAAGLLDASGADQSGTAVSQSAARQAGAVAIIDIAAMGNRTTRAVSKDEAQAAQGVNDLVAELRRLAWAR